MTLDLPERGLLLLRIRDEIRMTMDAYRTLYESSITFGVRKQLQAEEGLPELEATLAELLEKKKAAEALVLATKSKLELMERRLLERRALEDKQRAEEIVYVSPSQTTPAALPAPPHKHTHTHTRTSAYPPALHVQLPQAPTKAHGRLLEECENVRAGLGGSSATQKEQGLLSTLRVPKLYFL